MMQKLLQINWHQVVNEQNLLEKCSFFFFLFFNNKVNLDVNVKLKETI
jgi:hypothetical protein